MNDRFPELYDQFNIIERVHFTGGIIGLFAADETKIQNCIARLNAAGYRPSIVLPASQTFPGWIASVLLLVFTLFLYTRLPGYLIIGELIEQPTDTGEHRSASSEGLVPLRERRTSWMPTRDPMRDLSTNPPGVAKRVAKIFEGHRDDLDAAIHLIEQELAHCEYDCMPITSHPVFAEEIAGAPSAERRLIFARWLVTGTDRYDRS